MTNSIGFMTRWRAACRSLPLLVIVASGGLTVAAMHAVGAESNAKITKEQASQSALQTVPGQVTDVTVERKRGKNVYVVEIVADKGGGETDVLVDMESGKVLGVEH
jgi:uncharacterized membrane protein YkoI